MDTKYTDKAIKKKELVEKLYEIKFRGIEGISKEEFTTNKAHPVYIGFTLDLASKIRDSDEEEYSPEDFAKVFVEKIEEHLRYNKLDPGQLYGIHNFYDTLANTIFSRISGDIIGEEQTENSILKFDSYGTFYDIYDETKKAMSY